LDIPVNLVTASNNGDKVQDKHFILQSGFLLSALEHITPEQMFTIDPNNPSKAFSAVKGLQIASSQGQKIYQISQVNINSVMPNINLDVDTETEIQSAVSVGKEVIVHTDFVSVPGYTGAGYIIIDPDTGDGAYKISGGLNGGLLLALLGFIALAVIMFWMVAAFAASASVTAFGFLAVGELVAFNAALDYGRLIMKLGSNKCSSSQQIKILSKATALLVMEASVVRGLSKKIINEVNIVKQVLYEAMDIVAVGGGFFLADQFNQELNDPVDVCK